MGKDQELLDAARNGNFAMVEKILNHRSKKSGPLASLRRCPGPNTTDSCGYTCLHHAALNGHKDIVELLLCHDANPNIVDNKGSTALHLSAWTGDYEIVNMLLTQSSHVPNVNLKNNDLDTALHCAAQYGHTSVVSLLLQKGADPMCRNLKEESALDLAAQYGRTDTVELFLRTRPSLARHLTAKHSPLHLSARNGHKNVVKLLIDAKFDVNYCTETGSALHEAALFGKVEVVRLLLKSGINIELEDCQKRTVLDLLNDLNTSIAKQTKKLIREHKTILTADLDDSSTLMSDCSSHCISPPPGYTDNTPEHHNNDQTLTDGIASPAMTSASEFSFYEAPPNNRNSMRSSTGSDDYKPLKPLLSRSRDSILDGHSTSSSRSPSYLDYDVPPPLPPRHFTNSHSLEVNTNNLYESPPIPIAISCSPEDYTLLRRHNHINSYELEIRPESQSSIASSQSGYGRTGEKPVPPAKPPRKSLSPVNRSQTINCYDYNHTTDRTTNRNGIRNGGKIDRNCDNNNTDRQFSTLKDTRRRLIEESDFSLLYDQIANGTAIGLTTSSLNRPSTQLVVSRAPNLNSHIRSKSEHQTKYYSESFTDAFNDNTLKSSNNYTNNKTKRATVQIPIQNCDNIDAHCNGQTTPDYEPPSPTTAINGIQAVIQPMSMNGRCNDTIEDYRQQCPYYSSQTDCPFFNRTSINRKSFNYFNFCTEFTDEKMIPAIYAIQNEPMEYKKLQNGRRHSRRDIETLTEEELFAALDSSGYVRLSFRNKPLNTDNNNVIKKSVAVSTDNEIPIVLNNNYNNKYNNKKNIYNNYCETLKLDRSGEKENPFAGLCRGSIGSNTSSVKRRDISDGRKSLRRQRNFNCDINIYSTLKRNKNKKSKSMETSDKKALKVVKSNTSFDDCLTTGAKSGAESDQRSDSRISRLSGSPFDETAEWAEIANIMASFGSGIGRDSSLVNSELDNSYTSYVSKDSSSEFEEQSVEEWLTRIGLSEYANLLINNGFDNVLYMGSNVMDDSDLLEIGVTNASHRDRILSEAKKLPKVRLLTKSDEQMSVDQWLESLKLTQYRQSFQSNGYSEMSRVRNLWEVELNTVLEINKLGHRKRILASLGERLRLIEDLGLDDLDFDKLNLNISQLSVDEGFDTCSTTTTTNTNTKELNKSSDKSAKNKEKNTPKVTEKKNKLSMDSSQPITQWKHTNKELIDGSCKYKANYLGSTLVRELRGIDSTRASIQKLKTSTKGIAKIPQIILSISYTGVQFIDGETKQSVCEHEIRNIHCICQDSEDLNHFAYITKEIETNNHYCHVFSAQNTELVTEVILTLGQAFEIAYQMVMESTDKFAKQLTSNSSNICINTNNDTNNAINTSINTKTNTSINFNNPQNDMKANNSNNNNNSNNKEMKTKSESNVKTNNTFITTISITSSTEHNTNPKSKIAEQKPINQIHHANNIFNNNNKLAKNGQSSFISRRSEEPISSIPLPTVLPSKTVPIATSTATTAIPAPNQQTAKVKPIPATGKPSPPTLTRSALRPIPSPKPSTIPKPVTRAKPVPPFKPQILAKPTNK